MKTLNLKSRIRIPDLVFDTKKILLMYLLFYTAHSYCQFNHIRYKFKGKNLNTIGLYEVDPVTKTPLWLQTKREIANSLKGDMTLSKDGDTIFIKFWDITYPDRQNSQTTNIRSYDNGSLFAYKITDDTKIGFYGHGMTKITIPFRYRITADPDLEADFLNLGGTMMWYYGRSELFNPIENKINRDLFFAFGAFVAFSGTELDSSSTNGYLAKGEKKNIATFSYGIDIAFGINKFTILCALGFDNGIGRTASHWDQNNFTHGALHPWIGFGIGYGILEFKNKNKSQEQE